jgi:hypothetical protein
MNGSLKFTGLCRAATLVSVLFLTACSGISSKPASLEARAAARWDALLSGNVAEAYEYLAPGYRSSVKPIDYEIAFRLRKVSYTSAEYKSEECQVDVCTVKLSLGYRLIAPMRGVTEFNGKQSVDEKWVRVNNQWWFLPKN